MPLQDLSLFRRGVVVRIALASLLGFELYPKYFDDAIRPEKGSKGTAFI